MKKQNKPIAIVGIGCRFPGSSSSPQKFWELLINQKDAIIDVPSDRWDNRRFYDDDDDKPGKLRAKQGGFLQENVKEFDRLFFGISPIEASSMDPQQRMMLEVAYEAMEDAGISLESIKGTNTGVFVGGFTLDNYLIQTTKENRLLADSHTILGLSLTMLSNKLSYFYDLKGPSVTIDTACSSSLVATHNACQSIWSGESSMAMVGGVNFMLKPDVSIHMSKGKLLSRHSRSKAFDSDAAGYVRGEGAGLVMLKSYEEAIKDGDRIYALIHATGVNQDGRTNGVTVPNQDSQTKLIQKLYKDNDVNVDDVHYIEAHGTGTKVGDPIEFGALNEVISENRSSDQKCIIGSVKTNIGHLEAGAGVAGLIKAALVLKNNEVPANLHFNTPNPALNYDDSMLRVPTATEKLPEDCTSFVSVNSFGYGGTNAHAVLKQFHPNIEKPDYSLEKDDYFIFPVSARSKSALKELASDYREFIQENEGKFPQMLSNTIFRRTKHSDRLAIVASSTDELIEKIEAFEEDILVKGVVQGDILSKKPEVVFVYTGMGPQWWKMGRELMEKEPVFLEAVKECDILFKEISGWSILEELNKPEENSKIKETYIAQPANLVIQVALTRLLEHYGVSPDAVVGHSVGEVASAYISGALSLKEALFVSYHRSRLQHTTAGKGGMLAVGLPAGDIAVTLAGYDDVSIAAINSPNSVTLSGNVNSLEELAKVYQSMGAFQRLLDVDVPYHSPVMDLIEGELLDSLKSIKGKSTTIDLYSTVTGAKISGEKIDNDYWLKNVRNPVYFADAINAIEKEGYRVFVEVGPHPVLKNSMIECVNNSKSIYFFQTLNRKESEQLNFFENLSSLFTKGVPINWERWVKKLPHLSIPKYPWQKEYCWHESEQSIEDRVGRKGNAFLNTRVQSPELTYKVELNKYFFPFVDDHLLHERVVFPGACYIASAIQLYQEKIGEETIFGLENVRFHQILAVDSTKVQNIYSSFNSNTNTFSLHSKEEGGEDNSSWIKRATCKYVMGKHAKKSASIDIQAIYDSMNSTITEEEVYDKLLNAKLRYGPTFRAIDSIECKDRKELVAKIKGVPGLNDESQGYFIHPALLDACFQSIIVFADTECVPISVGRIHCYFPPGEEFLCYAKLKTTSFNSATADIIICNEAGEVAMVVEDFKCQEIFSNASKSDDYLDDCLYEVEWLEEKNSVGSNISKENQKNYVITNDYSYALPLLDQLEETVVLQPSSDFKELGDHHYEINFEDTQGVSKILMNDKESDISLIFILNLQLVDESLMISERCMRFMAPLLSTVRACSKDFQNKITLNLLTKGSQVVFEMDRTMSLEDSTLQGLGRLIGNEFPNWKVRMIDFEGDEETIISSEVFKIAMDKINNSKKQFEEIAIRNNRVYRKVMKSWDKDNTEELLETVLFKDRPLQLLKADFKDFDDLHFGDMTTSSPDAGAIEILVDSTCIAKKDYLKVTGKASGEILEDTLVENNIGGECSGVITRIGADVTKFSVGDRVIAMAPGTFQSYTTTSESLVAKYPENFNSDQACASLGYITVLYALRDKANLGKDDKLLIHNATEEAGLAAINYAKMVGANVFATVETDKQRSYLNSIGIFQIYDSESLDFSTEILEVTDGKGVDVIMGDLPKETFYQSVKTLASYGTFLDTRKANITDNVTIPIHLFNKNISYIKVDIDRMAKEKPERIAELLNDVVLLGEEGKLEPLPLQVFAPDKVSDAFKLMDEGNYLGKIIVNFKDKSVEVSKEEDSIFKSEKSYLITGGTKGLGLEIGKWLVSNGVRNLALLSRSGLKDPKTIKDVEAMKEKGVKVEVYSADVAELDSLELVFSQIEENLAPIAGIFHCAMVLDDGFLLDMNEDRFRNVLRPKIDGAMNLHNLTKDLELDYFVMFSSLSSLIGHMGQANYVVANTLLDSFAHVRRSQGLPATTINLGILAESGVISRSDNLTEMLQEEGILSFTNAQVLNGLEKILLEKPVQIGFFKLDWSNLGSNIGVIGQSLFQELITANVGSNNNRLTEEQMVFLDKFMSLDSGGKKELVIEFLIDELSKILKLSKDRIGRDKGLNFLGIDSILFVQLIRVINEKLAVEISPVEFLSGPSVNQLATIVIENVLENAEVELV